MQNLDPTTDRFGRKITNLKHVEEQSLTERDGCRCRPGTLDAYIVGEIDKSYGWMDAKEGDTVLDAGGNIGAASRYFLQRGCRVVAYEPDPENAALFRENAQGAELHEVALTSDGREMVVLYQNPHKNKGLHSTVHHKGRTEVAVQATDFQQEMDRVRPTHLKIDVEGAEHGLLWEAVLPNSVRQATVEFNLRKCDTPTDPKTSMRLILKRMEEQGFQWRSAKNLSPGSWDALIRFWR